MRKVFNIKDSYEILKEYKSLLEELKNDIELWIEMKKNRENIFLRFENSGYDIKIAYFSDTRNGYIKTTKEYGNNISYTIITDFVYLDNRVILEVI